VEATVGERIYRREVRPHTSYLVSHDPRIHLGLGQADRVDSLNVYWADGTLDSFQDLQVNQILKLRQGASGVAESVMPGAGTSP
jgi:hypothetical protein